ncbi:MAG TPA: hypothetical protein PKD90_20135, partial [Phnomibacter sp.]|nr:hypothetical protein [Phnomibacter sp.]
MRFPKPISIAWYAFSDLVCSALAWAVFYIFRQRLLYQAGSLQLALQEHTFYRGLVLVPLFWLLLHALVGSYRNSLYQRSRLAELTTTSAITIIGVSILFFILLIDDVRSNFYLSYYYQAFFTLLMLQWFIMFAGRALVLTLVKKQIKQGKAGYYVLIIGYAEKIRTLQTQVAKLAPGLGWHIAGMLLLDNTGNAQLQSKWPFLGGADMLDTVIEKNGIEKVVVLHKQQNKQEMVSLLSRLADKDVEVWLAPDESDLLTGAVKTSNLAAGPLMAINSGKMPVWQQNIKRLLDILVVFVAVLLLWPLFIFV